MNELIIAVLSTVGSILVAILTSIIAVRAQKNKDKAVINTEKAKADAASAERKKYETEADLLLIEPLKDRIRGLEAQMTEALDRIAKSEGRIADLEKENHELRKYTEELEDGANRLAKQVESLQGTPVYRPRVRKAKPPQRPDVPPKDPGA